VVKFFAVLALAVVDKNDLEGSFDIKCDFAVTVRRFCIWQVSWNVINKAKCSSDAKWQRTKLSSFAIS